MRKCLYPTLLYASCCIFSLQGFHTIFAKDCYHKSLVPLMDSIRDSIGPERPVYLTFDIDGIDPAYCPGTGEI